MEPPKTEYIRFDITSKRQLWNYRTEDTELNECLVHDGQTHLTHRTGGVEKKSNGIVLKRVVAVYRGENGIR